MLSTELDVAGIELQLLMPNERKKETNRAANQIDKDVLGVLMLEVDSLITTRARPNHSVTE